MKNRKNLLFALIVPLVVISGFVFASRGNDNGHGNSKKWEVSPDGIKYKAWEASPAGKKVRKSHDKISNHIKNFTEMQAVVTSVTFTRDPKSAGPKWLIVKIKDEEYMMQFIPSEFRQLKGLKVNDRIILKSRSAGYSPNHPFLIISGDYIGQDSKTLFKRDLSKNRGC